MLRSALVVVLGLGLSSCATQAGMREALFNRATFDLGCAREKLDAVQLNSAHSGMHREFGVTGCEKRATYIVRGDGVNGYAVVLNTEPNKP